MILKSLVSSPDSNDTKKIEVAFKNLLAGNWAQAQTPELWDGKAAKRITDCLVEIYSL